MLESNEGIEKENTEQNERAEYTDLSIFDELGMIIYVMDRDTDELLFVNRVGREALGITETDYIGRT